MRRLFYLTITPSAGELNVRMRGASGEIRCVWWRYERALVEREKTFLSVSLGDPATEGQAARERSTPVTSWRSWLASTNAST